MQPYLFAHQKVRIGGQKKLFVQKEFMSDISNFFDIFVMISPDKQNYISRINCTLVLSEAESASSKNISPISSVMEFCNAATFTTEENCYKWPNLAKM